MGISKLRNIQLAELEILKEIKRICEQNGITYYISGGTFLGAVRHKGFIPWDDDSDIAMPRSDYEKFIKLIKENPEITEFELLNYKYDFDFPFYVTKLVDRKFLMIDESSVNKRKIPAWVDIFPLDGVPEKKNGFRFIFFKINLYLKRALYNISDFDNLVKIDKKNRPFIEKVAIEILKKIPLGKLMKPRERMNKIDNALRKNSEKSSNYYMNFMGAYKFKSIIHKNVYGEGKMYEFEGEQFFGPKDYDTYLTIIYGDYMKLPPEHLRNVHNTRVE
ncbi:LicD family protein [Vagococcus lutrae]|uniref:LicD family protein n=1 Tax=Vagococcus lutrae TaxID=81947 RepID=UPI0023A9C7BD|nr:LicD family protein [Vagococcus lutrae]WEB81767.1 LicD family protein [Vagococcus lutrae]